VRLVADDGGEFLLDLPEALVLREGDGLGLDDGTWLAVRAADEEVCDISCPTPEALARIAWHLGNRHLPVQVVAGGLRIRDDHVIVAMLEGMGAAVTRRKAPFDPEGGAYARGHTHAHGGHGHHHHHD
jgi:urease accessory protein